MANYTELNPMVRAAVAWWWRRALRVDCSDQWDHTISHLHGAIMTHPDAEIRAELRFLRDIAEDHSHRCYEREQADIGSLLDGIHLLQAQAD